MAWVFMSTSPCFGLTPFTCMTQSHKINILFMNTIIQNTTVKKKKTLTINDISLSLFKLH